MTERQASFDRRAQRIGVVLGVGAALWVAFRVVRRVAEDPYVDFEAFYLAGRAVNDGTDIYRAGAEMYIYPPLLATLISPLARLPIRGAAAVWFVLAALATAWSMAAVWRELADRWRLPLAPRAAPAALGLALFVWVEQVRWEFEQGQCDWLLLAAMAATLRWMDRRPWLAGAALGLAINVKYLPLAMVAYWALRGRWRAVGWSLAGTAAWALAPAAALGWDRNARSLLVAFGGLAKLFGLHSPSQPGMVFPLRYEFSLSIPSGAARLCDYAGLGSAWIALAVAGALGLALAAAAAVYRGRGVPLFAGRGGAGEAAPALRGVVAWEWLGVLTAMLTFSPQMHNRHLFVLLPLPLAGAALALRGRAAAWHWQALAATALGPIAMALPFGTHGVSNDGAPGWQTFGGGAACVIAMYLWLLALGLPRGDVPPTGSKAVAAGVPGSAP